MQHCRICGGESDLSVLATERMFGLGGEFWYDQCGRCGCVQLRDVPADLGRYYGPGYYSFDEPGQASRPRLAYRRIRDALLFGRARWLGFLAAPVLPPRVASPRRWFRRTGVTSRSRVLDVGCGIGLLLRRLADEGYDRAMGVDPFIREDVEYGGRLLVRRAPLEDVEGTYDLVMFHHSLEHIAEQRETMAKASALLRPGGYCLVRIPIAGSWAWEEYRDRWVQLDAPRHLFLHTVTSIRILAESAGLRLESLEYDSMGFTLEGSELYRRDRPLTELASAGCTPEQRRAFERRARALNAEHRGDQAEFYLRKD